MKQFFTLLVIAIGFANASQAQTANATVFSENGDKFTLILNGEKQNDTPQTNVKLIGLTNEFYQARVDFEDSSLPDFTSKNFAVQKGFEVTYVIKQNKKGEYILRYQTASELGSTASVPAASSEPKTLDYVIEEEEEVEEVAPANISMTTTVAPGTSTTTTTTTTTTKPTTTGTNGEKVNVNMNVGGINMGVNMNIEGMDMDSDVVVEEKVVTKTTVTQTTTAPASTPVAREEVVVRSEKPVGCTKPMDTTTFNAAKKSIADKGFDDTRLSTAKQVVKANCMSSAQIVEVMGTFGFEETKLNFAKYAYDYCSDKNNYFMVNDAFNFSSSADELNEFIESK